MKNFIIDLIFIQHLVSVGCCCRVYWHNPLHNSSSSRSPGPSGHREPGGGQVTLLGGAVKRSEAYPGLGLDISPVVN